jgi:hypothetical protein
VAGRLEAVPLSDLGLDLLHFPALKLDDPSAFQTYQVLVNRLLGEPVFESFESLPEIMLHDQPAPNEEIQSPVDGGFSDSVPGASQARFEFFDGQMFSRRENDLSDGLPLKCDRKALLFEISPKKTMGRGGFKHDLPSVSRRISRPILPTVLHEKIPEVIGIPCDLRFPGNAEMKIASANDSVHHMG